MPANVAALLAIVAVLLALAAGADSGRRVLHVSLYPYIPNAAAAALTLKQDFERLHPNILVDISFNRNYYSQVPADKGLLFEDADVHEIDSVFLRDSIDRHLLAALPRRFAASLGPFDPIAKQAATSDGTLVAVPHWLCTDFLIYRADKSALAQARSLADLERILAPEHGLLLDLKGSATLGEIDLAMRVANDTGPESIALEPDPTVIARLRRFLALEPQGFGRNAAYDSRGDFYARQFARRTGSAVVGYSEMLNAILDETSHCRDQDHCVTAADLRVTAVPFQDNRIRPAIWIDLFAIDARAHGQTRTDAEAFISYAVSLAGYRSLLIPQPGENPRYLLPATEAALNDPHIRQTAPLTPNFRAILDQGTVVLTPHLAASLQTAANHLDAALPASNQ